jgi:electron transfer flavoprotein alpha subunit
MSTIGLTVLVMIKQVPTAGALEFDTERGVLIRDGVPTEVNTYDVRAVLSALEIKKRFGGEVVVMTMGPPDARAALQHCLALGADRAVHLSDRAFAGSDTLATSRALAAAAKKQIPDLVLCGRSSTDAETGNIGPQIAEWLAIPQVTAVSEYTVDDIGRSLQATRETDSGTERVHVKLPALLTVVEDVADETIPTGEQLESVDTGRIQMLTAKDLELDPAVLGSAGSPTTVGQVRGGPSAMRRPKYLDVAEDGEQEVLERVIAWIDDSLTAGRAATADAPTLPPTVRTTGPRLMVYAETNGQGVSNTTAELLAGAAAVADQMDGRVDAVVLGNLTEGDAARLASWGADHVIHVPGEDLEQYDTLRHTHVLTELIPRVGPAAVILPSSVRGRDLAPRVAARSRLGLTSDCVGVAWNGRTLIWHKPAFGDGVVAEISSTVSPAMATVRPGILQHAVPNPARRVELETVTDIELPRLMVTVEERSPRPQTQIAIGSAETVIGVGMGATGFLNEVQAAADLLGAAVGYTRKAVDAGFGSRIDQIGLSGSSIAPALYIAVGISGAIEHAVGITRSQRVLVIDSDEDSFMFEYADLAVVAEGRDFLGKLRQILAGRTGEQHKEEICTPA